MNLVAIAQHALDLTTIRNPFWLSRSDIIWDSASELWHCNTCGGTWLLNAISRCRCGMSHAQLHDFAATKGLKSTSKGKSR